MDRTVSTSSAAKRLPSAAHDESYFTSFSDLGAAIPTSEADDGQPGGLGADTNASLLSLSGIRSLLHPNAHLAEATERTPLLRQGGQRKARKRKAQRYVGGQDALNALEALPSEAATEASLAVCRQCEAMETPVSAVKLAITSQALFAIMSLLSEVLARGKEDHRLSQLQILVLQGVVMWMASIATLLWTRTDHAFLGAPGLRGWIWARAACAAISTVLFALAAQSLPIMNLVMIVYLSPIAFNTFASLVLSSPLPFRAQIVSISLVLGLTLLMQPTFLFPDNEGYQTVPASPIDLPPMGDYTSLSMSPPLAYLAACISAFFMAISLGLLSRAVKISIYHSITSNSLLTVLLSGTLLLWTSEVKTAVVLPSIKHALLLLAIVIVSLLAHLLQALSFQRRSPRRLSLLSFLQPIFSTGLQTVFLDHAIDVLPFAGSVLIAANIAWFLNPPSDGEEEEDEEW